MLKQHLEIDIKCFCKLFYPFDKYVLKKVIPGSKEESVECAKSEAGTLYTKGQETVTT